MIRDMKAAGCELTDEQQILAVLRSLPEPFWGQVKLVLTHNEGIKTFENISYHLELKVECRDANHSAALVARTGRCNGNSFQHKKKQRKYKIENQGPKAEKITKRQRDKHSGKKDVSKLKCYYVAS